MNSIDAMPEDVRYPKEQTLSLTDGEVDLLHDALVQYRAACAKYAKRLDPWAIILEARIDSLLAKVDMHLQEQS